MDSSRQVTKSMHVVILGGGPAGTACGLKLRALAEQMGRQVNVTVLEGKQFQGEQHYNQCVGVLSQPLPDLISKDLGVAFPHHLTRAVIKGYSIHSKGARIDLDEQEPSLAQRRVQYDDYMLEQTKSRGVTVLHARAVDLEFHADGVEVYTDNAPIRADVVVGAFGLDEGCGAMFSRLTSYRPPKALSSVVTKFHPGDDAMQAFGLRIHAFLPSDPRIEFAGITPKGNHLTINIAGRQVDTPLMEAFLKRADVACILPNLDRAGEFDPNDLRFYKGRFPCSQAAHPYGDRYVMVGDAAGLVRSFKGKGVTSAVQTGIRAAETILLKGVTERAFHEHYRTANVDLRSDLPYGQVMRLLTIWISKNGVLDAVIRAGNRQEGVRSVLMGAVSGHAPYRQILRGVMKPSSLAAILGSLKA